MIKKHRLFLAGLIALNLTLGFGSAYFRAATYHTPEDIWASVVSNGGPIMGVLFSLATWIIGYLAFKALYEGVLKLQETFHWELGLTESPSAQQTAIGAIICGAVLLGIFENHRIWVMLFDIAGVILIPLYWLGPEILAEKRRPSN